MNKKNKYREFLCIFSVLLCLTSVLAAPVSMAQNIEWSRKAGSLIAGEMFATFGYAVTTDDSGNAAVTGSCRGTIVFEKDTFLTVDSTDDFFLVKYNSAGVMQWVVHDGGPDYDEGNGVGMDAVGNVYAAGDFYDSARFNGNSLPAFGQQDIFIVKYDAAGKFQWVQKAGGTGNDAAWGLCADKTGNTYITGFYYGTAYFGSYTLTAPPGYPDAFVAKYNTSGTCLWATKISSGSTDYGYGVASDEAGNSYVTGLFSGTLSIGTYTLNGYGYSDIFIAKFDPMGNCLWAQQAGGKKDDDKGWAVSTDKSGNVYVAGAYHSDSLISGKDTLVKPGVNDREIYIAKLDPSGNFIWSQRAGGYLSDEAYGISADTLGNFFLSGAFSDSAGFGSKSLRSTGMKDVFVARYDSSGNCLWTAKAGGADSDYSFAVNAHPSGAVYVAGAYAATAVFEKDTFTAVGGADMFVFKIPSGFTGITKNNTSALVFDLPVFPNPAEEYINFVLPDDGYAFVTLYSVTAKEFYREYLYERQKVKFIQVSGFPAGMYLLKVETKDKIYLKKIIIQ